VPTSSCRSASLRPAVSAGKSRRVSAASGAAKPPASGRHNAAYCTALSCSIDGLLCSLQVGAADAPELALHGHLPFLYRTKQGQPLQRGQDIAVAQPRAGIIEAHQGQAAIGQRDIQLRLQMLEQHPERNARGQRGDAGRTLPRLFIQWWTGRWILPAGNTISHGAAALSTSANAAGLLMRAPAMANR